MYNFHRTRTDGQRAVVLLSDAAVKPIGWGFYNSASMFAVRLMQLEEEAISNVCLRSLNFLTLQRSLWCPKHGELAEAVELRRRLGLPCTKPMHTGSLIVKETVDVFGDMAVVASSAAWVDKLWILGFRMRYHWLDKRRDSMQINVKAGISYQQFRVVDICCYSGGFALDAARGGAINVTGVDLTHRCLLWNSPEKMLCLNNLDPERMSLLKEDAAELMKGAI
ncbi:Putative ribosomal RNA large subunit methyltransferase MJ1649 [Linum perenne]